MRPKGPGQRKIRTTERACRFSQEKRKEATLDALVRKRTGSVRLDFKQLTISGGNDEGVPPVPIPNTEVKPFSADGTWLETARESRSLPDPT